MVAAFSDFPLIMWARKYREMAVKARSDAQSATWFVPRWYYERQARHWENLATAALKELRKEIVRGDMAMEQC
jgi:hypothetical protein